MEETIEEVAKRTYQKGLKDDLSLSFHDGVKFGAEWQAERMYSEEEMKDMLEQTIEKFYKHRYSDKTKSEMKELWFEQFKKK